MRAYDFAMPGPETTAALTRLEQALDRLEDGYASQQIERAEAAADQGLRDEVRAVIHELDRILGAADG